MCRILCASALVLALAAGAPAQSGQPSPRPQDVESVYAPPAPPREDEGVNEGGVHTSLSATYLTDYVFRGVDMSESGGSEDSPNLQIATELSWDLGPYPHPFVGLFANIYDSDPASRFQEIRPFFGLEWNLRPLLFRVGQNTYIYPERDDSNTAEVFAQCTLDDSYFFRTDKPIFSPYVMAAYDYDLYHGFYVEFGASHDFVMEDLPLTITPYGHIAYVNNMDFFTPSSAPDSDSSFGYGTNGPDIGFQHYQVGVVITYGLNSLLNIPRRYGDIDLKGYLNYTDGIDNSLRADTQFWGGVGISFSY